MEKVLAGKRVGSLLLPMALVAGTAFSMIVIIYGVDAMASGVHDAFHDFRHAIGMACH